MLDVLARAPRVIFGVDAGAAFLLPDPHGRPGFVRCAGSAHVEDAAELAHEPLVKALVSTARPIIRWRLSENPQLKPFQDSCERLFDKMHAAILLPLMHDTRVIGGLAIGELPSGGHYGRDALKALAKLGRETGTAAQLIEHQVSGGAVGAGGVTFATVSEPTPDDVPAAITGDRYAVQRFLGSGLSKRVFLAHDTLLDRDVALALYHVDSEDENSRARFFREAKALGRLGDHPHIVTLYDIGEAAGQLFSIAEFVSGGDVADRIANAAGRPLPLKEAVRIADEVCQGLEHAHEEGVVHRDVKPNNVWLTPEGAARLGDFGLALVVDVPRITHSHMLIGTVLYMSPEQARAEAPDARGDLYALGVMLYEMTAGHVPFRAHTAAEVLTLHLNVRPEPPLTHNPDLPPEMDALILHLLQKAPEDRPQSAAAVCERLARVPL